MHITPAPRCPALFAFNTNGQLVAVRCGSWYCPDCAKINARMWSWRTRITIDKSTKPAYFWTLTLMPSVKSPEDGFKKLPKLWDRLRQWVKRHSSEKWSYIAFVEGQPQRDYMPHFHVISLLKCPKRLKDVAVWCGYGYEASETRVNSGKAASYVAKYASKQSPVTPKGFRRVRATQDWEKLPPSGRSSLLVRAKAEDFTAYLERVSAISGVSLDDLADLWLSKKTTVDIYPVEVGE